MSLLYEIKKMAHLICRKRRANNQPEVTGKALAIAKAAAKSNAPREFRPAAFVAGRVNNGCNTTQLVLSSRSLFDIVNLKAGDPAKHRRFDQPCPQTSPWPASEPASQPRASASDDTLPRAARY
jgi:hypothetical protein